MGQSWTCRRYVQIFKLLTDLCSDRCLSHSIRLTFAIQYCCILYIRLVLTRVCCLQALPTLHRGTASCCQRVLPQRCSPSQLAPSTLLLAMLTRQRLRLPQHLLCPSLVYPSSRHQIRSRPSQRRIGTRLSRRLKLKKSLRAKRPCRRYSNRSTPTVVTNNEEPWWSLS